MVFVNFAKFLKLRDFGVVPHWCRGCLSPGLLLLTGIRPENPGRAPKSASSCGITLVRPSGCALCRRSLRACCLGGLACSPFSPTARLPARGSLFSGLSSVEPVSLAGRSTASPTPEYSTTVFQVHRGGSNPLSLFSVRRRGCVFAPSRSVCLSPISPTLP